MNPKKNKIQKLLDVLSGADTRTLDGFKAFDDGARKLKDDLLRKVRADTLEDVNGKLGEMKRSLSLDPLLKALATLEENFYSALENMSGEMEKMSAEHEQKMQGMGKESMTRHFGMENKMSEMHDKMIEMLEAKTAELNNLRSEFNTLLSNSIEDVKGKVIEAIGRIDKSEGNLKTSIKDLNDKIDISRNEADKSLKTTRTELISAINSRGGNANRNIAVGGNTSVLSRYTDINLRAGSNVTLTYSQNNTTKYTDLTIAATGGSGTTRTIARTAVSSTIGAVDATDYVTIATAGVQLTLPTAVGNDNLYTIKNIAASSVLVATTSAQTIDGDTTLILNTQYTAVDLINDGDDNWSIT